MRKQEWQVAGLLILLVAVFASLGGLVAWAETKPRWTMATCPTESCVTATLSELMYPDVAVKAKIVPKFGVCGFGEMRYGCVEGYYIFYPER